jgi:hypothetical protein
MEGTPVRRWEQKKKRRNKPLYAILAAALLVLCLDSGVLSADRHAPSTQTTESLSYTFSFSEPLLTDEHLNNQTFTKIDLTDCFSYAQPGFPALPVYPAQILLPQGTTVAGLHVSTHGTTAIPSDVLQKPILPEQEFIRIGMNDTPPFVMNTSTYASPIPVFDTIYDNQGIGYCRGYAILTVYLYPVQYIPKTGSLSYFQEMAITVDLQRPHSLAGRGNTTFLRNSQADKKVISEMVTNPSLLTTYEPPSDSLNPPEGTSGGNDTAPLGDDAPLDGPTNGLCNSSQYYPYVIITSNSLKSTTGYPYNWTSLLNHRKTYNGLNGTIVTVQDIDACHAYWNTTALFNDSPAHIREFCKDAYLHWGTEYILLGGDWDATVSHQIVPYRLFTDREETDTYKTMACDLYYSHLDGTWYYAAQGIWGGGRSTGVNDYYGELSVGRIAVYNASMVSNAVQKIIWYDLNASGPWLSEASFLGGDLGWTSTSKQYMEEIRLGTDTYRTFTGFEEWNTAHPETPVDTSERLYHADLGSNYKTYLSNSIVNDNASIISHIDHSDWNSPFGLPMWSYRINTKPFFGYSQGCLAGRYQEGYAGSEQLMCRYPDRNAFALVLNIGYGYGSSSNTNGPSQYIESYFWDYFFNNQSTAMTNWQLGKAMAYALDKMSAKIDISSHAWCYAWYSAAYFGDPAQLLRLTDTPANTLLLSNETPTNGTSSVPLTTTTLSIHIEQTYGHLFNYTIHSTPNIGSTTAQNTGNGTKTCAITGLSYSTTYHWYVNATDGTSWTNATYHFTTQAAPINNPPVCSNPLPQNGSTNIPLNTTMLSITIRDPEGDHFTWMITTTPNIGSNTGTNATNGTKTCAVSGLTSLATYTWVVHATDGHHWTNRTYHFTTLYIDTVPPQITTIVLTASTPPDTQPGFGWENTTCTVTDNINVHDVHIIVITPNSTTVNSSMHKKTGTSTYYYNTTFLWYGTYSYHIWANDTSNNHATSTSSHFSLAPNWDIDDDGACSLLDLIQISNTYGQTGIPGWIAEDVDNNGRIQVLDLALVSDYYGGSW